MKVLWCGDAVASTGFARCTHAACDALAAAGHEVHVLGINYYGDPHEHPYRIWPCYQPLDGGHDPFGATRLPLLVYRLKPDVVVLLNDPWNVPEYLRRLKAVEGEDGGEAPADYVIPPVVGWLAVDAMNQHAKPLDALSAVAVWTRWAGEELQRGGYGGEPVVIPLGVDGELFRPRPREEAREAVFGRLGALKPPPGAFVVGVVGRNQPRKRLDLTIKYFAEWIRSRGVEDAYLYLHVAPTGDRGVDIRSLIRHFGIPSGRVILAEPPIGTGMAPEAMPEVYGAMDVYFTTTQGEGWGLPALEAMACGVPVIAPDWSGLGDWARGAAVLVPCLQTAPSAPLNGHAHTVGGVPDEATTVEALDAMYRSEVHRREHSRRGLRLAAGLTWGRTGAAVVRLLEDVVRAHEQTRAGVELAVSAEVG